MGLHPSVHAWAEAIVDALGWETRLLHVSVYLYDPAAEGLRLMAQRRGADEDRDLAVPGEWLVPLHDSICGWVYRSASPALIADTRHHAEYRPHPAGAGRSKLAVPILVEDRPVGVIDIESRQVGAFGVGDVEALRAVATEAAARLPAAVTGAVLDSRPTAADSLC